MTSAISSGSANRCRMVISRFFSSIGVPPILGLHGRVDRSWVDGVDAYPVRSEPERRVAGHPPDRALRRVIGDGPPEAGHDTADRGHVHDRAAARISHLRDAVLHPEPDTDLIDGDDRLEALEGLADRIGFAVEASVVDEDVHSAELPARPVDDGLPGRFVGHVEVAGDGLPRPTRGRRPLALRRRGQRPQARRSPPPGRGCAPPLLRSRRRHLSRWPPCPSVRCPMEPPVIQHA